MFINLREAGIKRLVKPGADLVRIREHHPEVLRFFDEIVKYHWNKYAHITSGYRDTHVKGGAKNSPHYFGIALDVSVGHILNQIEFGRICLKHGFTRLGLYPQKGIVHIDIADAEWIKKYRGTPYWSFMKLKYKGFYDLEKCIKYIEGRPGNGR